MVSARQEKKKGESMLADLGVREIDRERQGERIRDQGMTLFWFTAYYHHNPLSCFPLCSPGTPLASSLR